MQSIWLRTVEVFTYTDAHDMKSGTLPEPHFTRQYFWFIKGSAECTEHIWYVVQNGSETYKLKFSFQTGLRSWGTVFVRFFIFPTWTVTYGSLVPVLSLPIRPWAQITEHTTDKPLTNNNINNMNKNRLKTKIYQLFYVQRQLFKIMKFLTTISTFNFHF